MAGPGVAVLERLLPLVLPDQPDPFVFAHLAQSLDGAIATATGQSQWLSSREDQVHAHQLRALADAVVVGVGTVLTDDPQLTVRHVEGADPARVVIDPRCRLASSPRRILHAPGQTLLFCAEGNQRAIADVEVIPLPARDGVIAPRAILTALEQRGHRRILIEGGGVTVGRFLAEGCIHRLHLVVAPVLVGGGRPALPMPVVLGGLSDCPRPETRVSPLGVDWLFDCTFESAR